MSPSESQLLVVTDMSLTAQAKKKKNVTPSVPGTKFQLLSDKECSIKKKKKKKNSKLAPASFVLKHSSNICGMNVNCYFYFFFILILSFEGKWTWGEWMKRAGSWFGSEKKQ